MAAASSRVIVKNLPKYVTEERLRQHFGQKGEVTDVRLMRTEDGTSRRFGFVGYRTPQEAQAAVKHFHNTFVDTAHVLVELARPVGDDALGRPWGKHSKQPKKSSAPQATSEQTAELEAKKQRLREQLLAEKQHKEQLLAKLYVDTSDVKLNEFLSAMAPRVKKTAWENDDPTVRKAGGADIVAKKKQVLVVKSKKTGGEGVYHTKTHITFDDDAKTDDGEDDEEYQDMSSLPAAASGDAVDKDEETADDDVMDVMDEREISGEELVHVLKQSVTVGKGRAAKKIVPEVPVETVAESGRLFVRNIPFSCTEDDLTKAFQKFGPLSEVHMPLDSATKQGKGFAYVMYLIPEHAVLAMSKMDGTIFQGRLLHVLPASAKPSEQPSSSASSSSFKAAKEVKRKTEANAVFNWNSLYMSSDAVAAAMATKLRVSKSDLLDHETTGGDAASMAVRLALAETNIISDTKTYLEQHGVVLDALERGATVERSRTVLLVKNISHTTTQAELRSLFGAHGDLVRVVLPPTRTIAVVEFAQPSEARAAFRQLAYSKFKHLPLYLEWAPVGVFSAPAREPAAVKREEDEEQEEAQEHAWVFVKNVAFSTTDDSLRRVFESVGQVVSAEIARKNDPKHAGQRLSMGFGFVEYATRHDADAAIKTLQGYELDGHALQLKLSHRGAPQDASTATTNAAPPRSVKAKTKLTKLVVRNVPFEATVRELRELFKPFGELKTVRLPKKFDGSHRGFAFVDFVTHQDAKMAMTTLISTHLYGRHLVLEWAKVDDDSIDALRDKTAAQLRSSRHQQLVQQSRKRQRIGEHDNDDDNADAGGSEADEDSE